MYISFITHYINYHLKQLSTQIHASIMCDLISQVWRAWDDALHNIPPLIPVKHISARIFHTKANNGFKLWKYNFHRPKSQTCLKKLRNEFTRSVLHVQSFTVKRTIANSGWNTCLHRCLKARRCSCVSRHDVKDFEEKFNLTLMLMGGCSKLSEMHG